MMTTIVEISLVIIMVSSAATCLASAAAVVVLIFDVAVTERGKKYRGRK
jgi:hypothetical protein